MGIRDRNRRAGHVIKPDIDHNTPAVSPWNQRGGLTCRHSRLCDWGTLCGLCLRRVGAGLWDGAHGVGCVGVRVRFWRLYGGLGMYTLYMNMHNVCCVGIRDSVCEGYMLDVSTCMCMYICCVEVLGFGRLWET